MLSRNFLKLNRFKSKPIETKINLKMSKNNLMKKPIESEESDSTDVISSSDEEERWKEIRRSTDDLPPDYWSIQKLVKYIKAGNPTATMIALCCLKDNDLTTHINQMVCCLRFVWRKIEYILKFFLLISIGNSRRWWIGSFGKFIRKQ